MWEQVISYFGGANTAVDPTTASKIVSFRDLPIGWDYGMGGPITEPVIQRALGFNSLLLLLGFSYTDAFPGGGGELVVAAGHGDHYIEVIVEPGGEQISIAYDYKREQVFYRLRRSPDESYKTVLEVAGKRWSAYTSPIRESLTQQRTSGVEQPSKTIKVHYQLSDVSVSPSQITRSANTSVHILENTALLPASHPFFGSLKPTCFQLELA
jgi:hypothetical protein